MLVRNSPQLGIACGKMQEKHLKSLQYPAGDKKINWEEKCKKYSNSLHSATARNHILKWKLHLGQVHGYFMDFSCHWLYITHVAWQLLHDGMAVNDNSMQMLWCLSTVCIFGLTLLFFFFFLTCVACLCKCLCCMGTECHHLKETKVALLLPFAWLVVIAKWGWALAWN